MKHDWQMDKRKMEMSLCPEDVFDIIVFRC